MNRHMQITVLAGHLADDPARTPETPVGVRRNPEQHTMLRLHESRPVVVGHAPGRLRLTCRTHGSNGRYARIAFDEPRSERFEGHAACRRHRKRLAKTDFGGA